MKTYNRPKLISFNSHKLLECIGPAQSAYTEFHYKQTTVLIIGFKTHHINSTDATRIVKAQIAGDKVTIA